MATTTRQLALAAGNELGGWSRRRLESRLTPDERKTLEDYQALRGLYAQLGEDDTLARFGSEARARLRMQVRARVREEAGRAAAPRAGFLPRLAAASCAAALVALVLGLVMSGPPAADKTVVATHGNTAARAAVVARAARAGELQIFLTRNQEGDVLNWSASSDAAGRRSGGAEAGGRYLVTAGTLGHHKVVGAVCGTSTVVRNLSEGRPEGRRARLETYSVVRLSERCNLNG